MPTLNLAKQKIFLFVLLVFGAIFFVSTLATWLAIIPTNVSDFVSPNLLFLGIISGILQLVGYLFYISNADIEPHPVTWFMFAYGTFILTILEWDTHATIPELILPSICTLFAIYVAAKCWTQARQKNISQWWPRDWWPEDKWERWSFISDIVITIGYILAWILASYAFLQDEYRSVAILLFLFLSNISTFPSFYPLLRETYFYPHKEHWVPWLIWSLAYGILGYVTYLTHGSILHPLMFYPVSNAVLHAAVAGLVLWRK